VEAALGADAVDDDGVEDDGEDFDDDFDEGADERPVLGMELAKFLGKVEGGQAYL